MQIDRCNSVTTSKWTVDARPQAHHVNLEKTELVVTRVGCRCLGGRCATGLQSTRVVRPSCTCFSAAVRVVIVLSSWLKKVCAVQQVQFGDVLACDDRPNDETNEDNKHHKIQDCVAENTSPPKFGLLHGVDGWADLTTWS